MRNQTSKIQLAHEKMGLIELIFFEIAIVIFIMRIAAPTDGIERLHLLYDKIGGIRETVYHFVTLCVGNNAQKGFDNFFVESSL